MALTEDEQAEWRERMRAVMVGTRFIKSLGVQVDAWSADAVVLRVPFDEQLTNDGREYHGGALAAVLDTAGAAAVWAGHDFDKGLRASTVSMTVNYTGRAAPGTDLIATARCVKRGRDIAFSEMRVTDPAGTLVATGTLVYRIVP
ncbi:MAG TPA: PaaI family thioesterase [Acidimicrobiia bacterium]|nr:PaaI family thioesterase [Acidimicrobiia bacterium]